MYSNFGGVLLILLFCGSDFGGSVWKIVVVYTEDFSGVTWASEKYLSCFQSILAFQMII